MPNPNYIAGRRLEYDTVNALKELGYRTIRAAGSHGIIDVLGWDSVNRYAIQCKKGDSPFTKAHFHTLKQWAGDLVATPILVEREYRKRMVWKILRYEHDLTFLEFKPEKAIYR